MGSSLKAKYVFLEEIGTGGMGVVYKAKQSLLNRVVAIKTIHLERLSKERILRFQREAEAASRLSHPNLVSVFDFGLTEQGQPYMVMDFLEGVLLSDMLKSQGSISLAEAQPILSQVCAGLAYAHSQGVIHRDLKPSNIMVCHSDSNSPTIRIFDFGIAKILSENKDNSNLTQTGDIMGSPNYMSPEQVMGRTMDHRSDIYSLGCVIFEVLTGVPPFLGKNSMDTALKHVNDSPPTLHDGSLGKIFPPEMERAVAKALQKDPEKRYQSVGELGKEFEMAAQAKVPESFTPAEIASPATSGGRENASRLLVIGLMLVCGALAAYAFMVTTSHRSEPTTEAGERSIASGKKDEKKGSSAEKSQPGQSGKNAAAIAAVADPSEALIKAATDETIYRDENAQKPQYGGALFAGQTISPTVFRERAVLPPQVKELRCAENNMNDDYLEMVKDKPLTLLSLRYTLVTNRGLGCLHMPTIVFLKLEGQKVTDEGIANLSKLKNLRRLSLINNSITDVGLSRLKVFKQLQFLNLDKNLEVTDQGLHYLASLPISHLWLDFDQISDNGLRQLMAVKTLRELHVSHTRVTDEGLKVIAQMPLVAAEMEGMLLTDAGLMHLAASKTLREIRIADTLITEAGRKKFAAVHPQCKIVQNHDEDYLY